MILYGKCTGVETYTGLLGGKITIPAMEAKYYESGTLMTNPKSDEETQPDQEAMEELKARIQALEEEKMDLILKLEATSAELQSMKDNQSLLQAELAQATAEKESAFMRIEELQVQNQEAAQKILDLQDKIISLTTK